MTSITGMQSTRTEISMAGNQRESGLTFAAAEAGLRDGENFVADSISKNVYTDPANGLFSDTDEDPDYMDYGVWATAQLGETELDYASEQPRFFVKYLGDRFQNPAQAINIGGYGKGQPGKVVSNFRVTARGAGQTGNSHRTIQSYFGKEF